MQATLKSSDLNHGTGAKDAEDLIENVVEVPSEVVGQEAKDQVAVELQQRVLAAVAAVGGGVG